MNDRTFVCTASDPFDLFGLRESVAREIIGSEKAAVDIYVRHPDREADGSCRWCGCRDDEVVTVRGA